MEHVELVECRDQVEVAERIEQVLPNRPCRTNKTHLTYGRNGKHTTDRAKNRYI